MPDLGGNALVTLVGVEKSYAMGERRLPVLGGVDCEVRRGEVVAIMGPSGAGKSTLLACVAGLEAIDRGRAVVLGQDLVPLDAHARTLLRRRIGIVYQFFNLLANLSAKENVALPFWIEGQEPPPGAVDAALERVGLSARSSARPSELSGGEMQLVAIARAIVRRPPLLLADEPTGSVNVALGRQIMATLSAVTRDSDSGLLFVTHNPEHAALADRVLFLRDGVIVPGATLAPGEHGVAAIHRRLEELGI